MIFPIYDSPRKNELIAPGVRMFNEGSGLCRVGRNIWMRWNIWLIFKVVLSKFQKNKNFRSPPTSKRKESETLTRQSVTEAASWKIERNPLSFSAGKWRIKYLNLRRNNWKRPVSLTWIFKFSRSSPLRVLQIAKLNFPVCFGRQDDWVSTHTNTYQL